MTFHNVIILIKYYYNISLEKADELPKNEFLYKI